MAEKQLKDMNLVEIVDKMLEISNSYSKSLRLINFLEDNPEHISTEKEKAVTKYLADIKPYAEELKNFQRINTTPESKTSNGKDYNLENVAEEAKKI